MKPVKQGKSLGISLSHSSEKIPVTDPDGERILITGKILSIKERISQWGLSFKMLVQDDREFRVYGSVPSKFDEHDQIGEGDRISFMARVKKSKDDPYFGFYTRPTKVERC